MDSIAFGFVDGHLVTWKVRDIVWCDVCGLRESTTAAGMCVRCEADARLLVHSVFGALAQGSIPDGD